MARHPSRPRGQRPGPPRSPRDGRRRRLGQNFLVDAQVVARVLERAAIAPGDLVVDLGAGRGALTRPLRDRGATVVAVELDRDLADRLRRDHAHDRDVEVVEGDALAVPLPDAPFRVVASPPYNRSTDVLRRLLTADVPLVDATLVLQLETARRVSGQPAVGAFSLAFAPWYAVEVVDLVPRRAFRPVPAVDSAVLQVAPRAVPWLSPARYADWQRFVERVFRASGRTAADRLDATLGSKAASRVTARAHVTTVRPPSRLPVEAWLALFRALPEGGDQRT